MHVALIGISGHVGTRLADELIARGHTVTGIARSITHLPARKGVTYASADATQSETLIPLFKDKDAVISATRFVSSNPQELLNAVRRSGVPRLLMVGGAGSLELAPGKRLLESPGFPEAYRPEATAGLHVLNILRATADVDWTFLSPSAIFAPGERTGIFRLDGDQLLTDATGKSHISMEDFAIAMVDELEHPLHRRRRFTVGY